MLSIFSVHRVQRIKAGVATGMIFPALIFVNAMLVIIQMKSLLMYKWKSMMSNL